MNFIGIEGGRYFNLNSEFQQFRLPSHVLILLNCELIFVYHGQTLYKGISLLFLAKNKHGTG